MHDVEESRAGRGRLYVIAAPSGAGKTSLVKALMERDAARCDSRSPTRRAQPRPNEVDGRDYHFVVRRALSRQWSRAANSWNTRRSSTITTAPACRPCSDALDARRAAAAGNRLAGRPPGARHGCRRRAASSYCRRRSRALEQRLRQRSTDSESVIRRRLRDSASDIAHWPEFDYRRRQRPLRSGPCRTWRPSSRTAATRWRADRARSSRARGGVARPRAERCAGRAAAEFW